MCVYIYMCIYIYISILTFGGDLLMFVALIQMNSPPFGHGGLHDVGPCSQQISNQRKIQGSVPGTRGQPGNISLKP